MTSKKIYIYEEEIKEHGRKPKEGEISNKENDRRRGRRIREEK